MCSLCGTKWVTAQSICIPKQEIHNNLNVRPIKVHTLHLETEFLRICLIYGIIYNPCEPIFKHLKRFMLYIWDIYKSKCLNKYILYLFRFYNNRKQMEFLYCTQHYIFNRNLFNWNSFTFFIMYIFTLIRLINKDIWRIVSTNAKIYLRPCLFSYCVNTLLKLTVITLKLYLRFIQ